MNLRSIESCLDRGAWSAWSYQTTNSYTGLANGQHTFEVKVKDAEGAEDPTPATWTFTVSAAVNQPPDTRITDGPSGTIDVNSATFKWTGSDDTTPVAQLVYSYHLDQGAWSAFSSATVEVRVRHRDGSWRTIEAIANDLLDDPAVQGIVVNSRDITERKLAQARILAALKEKEILLKEIHHRVKNNLQLVTSLLRLQSHTLSDPAARAALRDCQERIRSMTRIHDRLYATGDLARVEFQDYTHRLVADLLCSHGLPAEAIRVSIDAEDVALSLEQAIPCGLGRCLRHPGSRLRGTGYNAS